MHSTDAINLPLPGPLLGLYPQRGDAAAPWLMPWVATLLQRCWPQRNAADTPLAAVRRAQSRWLDADRAPDLRDLRARLSRQGFDTPALRSESLGCAAAAMQRTLGRDPFDTQLQCALILLDDQLAEMATGEGKTLAVALAAAVAALAGVPVHVMTANDYLAARDAATLRPFFDALGLSVGVVQACNDAAARRAAYACDLTYCTAREVGFDSLRDRQILQAQGSDLQRRSAALAGQATAPLLLRGLCMALVDEADSLLIDEATMPLILAHADDDPTQRAACFQALSLARRLQPGVDAQIEAGSQSVQWTEQGLSKLDAISPELGGAWLNRRHCRDLASSALVALHALQADRDYLVRDGAIELLDAVTGRAAPGRVWSRGLQTLVELKEGLKPSPQTRTSAQTSYQRLFARYWRLAGSSGTLTECRAELMAVYGKRVVSVPLRKPSQRLVMPPRLFADDAARTRALAVRVAALHAQGRPTLIGVASVAQAGAVSQALADAGIVHQVLDARHDAEEAAIVARAGQAGAVTVATAMAGRGTDIELDADAQARGGLHVICCQDNASARLDRQFIGRAARQGDAGSAETWLAQDAALWRDGGVLAAVFRGRKADQEEGLVLQQPGWRVLHAARQRACGQQVRRLRRRLLDQELSWQSRLDFTQLHA